jgi:predicted  nucleic acid-binding Zn-ribbon protein
METIVQGYQRMGEDANQPKTFREFYQYWWTKNEDAYQNLFKTEEFSKLLGQVSEASFEFKKSFDQFLEQQLKLLPIPTKTDLDSLYKTVYELKKQVRAMAKKLSDLENKISSTEQ